MKNSKTLYKTSNYSYMSCVSASKKYEEGSVAVIFFSGSIPLLWCLSLVLLASIQVFLFHCWSFEKIQTGMQFERVKQILGNPTIRESVGAIVDENRPYAASWEGRWYFIYITFDSNGKVKEKRFIIRGEKGKGVRIGFGIWNEN
jgi:hypothetical protein